MGLNGFNGQATLQTLMQLNLPGRS
ncbi:hypothetical protein EYZ11_009553 [Aspergillus tanneri]|uniref:Uncharacterized protein n=1 Tax=Aspergillus tanneri TaxID=1220188 RepID=A0A4S3J834_9EURO|nr:hypothetical protein EYZ11_009553 [Aspergillus tanneri]